MITFAIQSRHFHKRLNWQLSSLAKQTEHNFIVDVSVDNEDTDTLKVLDFFDSKLNLNVRKYDLSFMKFRANCRNAVIKDCDTEWLYFADSDHIYEPQYFEELAKTLSEDPYKSWEGLITCGRRSVVAEKTDTVNKLINNFNYPTFIPNTLERYAKAVNEEWTYSRAKGAGYFQLINMNHCDHGGIYVEKIRDRDWEIKDSTKARSDVDFRKRIGFKGYRKPLPDKFAKWQYHLQHYRQVSKRR